MQPKVGQGTPLAGVFSGAMLPHSYVLHCLRSPIAMSNLPALPSPSHTAAADPTSQQQGVVDGPWPGMQPSRDGELPDAMGLSGQGNGSQHTPDVAHGQQDGADVALDDQQDGADVFSLVASQL